MNYLKPAIKQTNTNVPIIPPTISAIGSAIALHPLNPHFISKGLLNSLAPSLFSNDN